VVNATRILLMLRQADHLSVAQVAEELGVARSTAHRLMTTLQSQGLLHQAAARQAYTPGPALVELGASVIGAVGLQQRVRPVLDRLSEQVGETSHLLVLLGDEVLFVDGVEGRYAIRAANRVGARELAHTSAAGKVLLAGLSTEELRRRYPKTRLSGGTDQALKTRADLEAELQVTRARGYGLNVSESEDDLCAVSVALDGGAGAVSVSGPASRMSKNIEDVAQRIREALSTLL
jgi:DNA-binding IclR family transcriptional regulator